MILEMEEKIIRSQGIYKNNNLLQNVGAGLDQPKIVGRSRPTPTNIINIFCIVGVAAHSYPLIYFGHL